MKFLEGHRVYKPYELLDCWTRNLWIMVQAVTIGYPGLEPEQDGGITDYRVTQFDQISALLILLIVVTGSMNWKWVFLAFLTPVMPSMLVELGNDITRGPRVWLSRWYLTIIPLVAVLSDLSWWYQAGILMYWTIVSWRVSGHYRTLEGYYRKWLEENPNPDRYRLTALAFEYLRTSKISLAEDEYSRALDYDPKNLRANVMMGQFAMNRQYHESGIVGVGFSCRFCGFRDAGFLRDGDTMTTDEYCTFILKVCPKCGEYSEVAGV